MPQYETTSFNKSTPFFSRSATPQTVLENKIADNVHLYTTLWVQNNEHIKLFGRWHLPTFQLVTPRTNSLLWTT